MPNNYGPLAALIGVWEGQHGKDVSPEPDAVEINDFRETLVFEAADDLSNAEQQDLWVVRYHQLIYRNRDNKHLHDQVGYWSWDPTTNQVIQSVTIPRGVCLVATGGFEQKENTLVFEVTAGTDNADSGIAQTTFMSEKANTAGYQLKLSVSDDTLNYTQSTLLDIYGNRFDHTDENTLIRKS